jgi:hypothetical protein
MTALRLILVAVVLFGAIGGVYYWNAKTSVAMETQAYSHPVGDPLTHRFELLQYRHWPILVWRSTVEGTHAVRAEHTFGAQVLERLERIQWCGDGRGVLVEAVSQYDSGESRSIRIYQDFVTGSLLTTLDLSATDVSIDDAVRACRSAPAKHRARPQPAVNER